MFKRRQFYCPWELIFYCVKFYVGTRLWLTVWILWEMEAFFPTRQWKLWFLWRTYNMAVKVDLLVTSDVFRCSAHIHWTTAAKSGRITHDKPNEEANTIPGERLPRMLILPTPCDINLLFTRSECKHIQAMWGSRFLREHKEFSLWCEGQTQPIQVIFLDKNWQSDEWTHPEGIKPVKDVRRYLHHKHTLICIAYCTVHVLYGSVNKHIKKQEAESTILLASSFISVHLLSFHLHVYMAT